MTQLNWIRNAQTGTWYDLLKLNLASPYFTSNFYGIYAIWYVTSNGGKIIKIGAGYIGERLKAERSNPDISRYSQIGQLKVTWAIVSPASQVDGILGFLNDSYSPVLGEVVSPSVRRVPVNLIGD